MSTEIKEYTVTDAALAGLETEFKNVVYDLT